MTIPCYRKFEIKSWRNDLGKFAFHFKCLTKIFSSNFKITPVWNSHWAPWIQKMCTRWVLKVLTDVYKAKRIEATHEFFIHHDKDGEKFLNCTVTGNKTWVLYKSLESKYNRLAFLKLTTKTRKRKTKFEHLESDGNSFLGLKVFDSYAKRIKK